MPDDRLVGTQLGKYLVKNEIGFGGMSVVYLAYDEVLKRDVAIKVLHAHLARREESRKRFNREARAVAKLRHTHILQIYDFAGDESEQAYIVTEYIRGPTLREFIEEQGQIQPEVGAIIGAQLASALAHAHDNGVVHRDVKPENVMIRPDGILKLMDFGIAQVRDTQKMTETGSLLGSPAHMAPEVIKGDEPDSRADVFSLGTVLYYLVTSSLPFEGKNAPSVLRAVSEGDYKAPQMRNQKVGRRLGNAIEKCLAVDPEGRFQSMEMLESELRTCAEEVGISKQDLEIKHFFENPVDVGAELTDRIMTTLEIRGAEALRSRQVARAVDCFNRVLAIDEDHEGVKNMMQLLDSRRRWVRVLLSFIIMAVIFMGIYGLFPSGEEVAEPGAPEVEALPEQPGETLQMIEDFMAPAEEETAILTVDDGQGEQLDSLLPVADPGTDPAVEEDAALAETAERNEPERAETSDELEEDREELQDEVSVVEVVDESEIENEISVRFHVTPPAVSITIDGRGYGPVGEIIGGQIPLTSGSHDVIYRHPAGVMDSVARTLLVPEELPEEADYWNAPRVRLDWSAARLLVESDIPSTVILEGSPIGVGGETIGIPMSSISQSVTIAVVPSAGTTGRQVERTLMLRANELTRIVTTLE